MPRRSRPTKVPASPDDQRSDSRKAKNNPSILSALVNRGGAEVFRDLRCTRREKVRNEWQYPRCERYAPSARSISDFFNVMGMA